MEAGPEVQLHPQLTRSAPAPAPLSTSSSSPSPAHAAAAPASPLATEPFFPALDSMLSSTSIANTSSGSSSNAAPSKRARSPAAAAAGAGRRPTAGLVDLDASDFPTLALESYPEYSFAAGSTHAEVRVLSAHQLARLHDQHCRVKLPEEELFPWLHGGADIQHSPAAHYFGYRRGRAAPPPSYRGLTVIHAPTRADSSRSALRRSNASSTDSWSSATSSSTNTSSSLSLRAGSRSSSLPSSPTGRLVSSFDASQILVTNHATGETRFALPNPRTFQNVNLRHFGLQAAKYATVSDVVVYGTDGIDEAVIETALKVREAMNCIEAQRGYDAVHYNVFVVSDAFSVFEQHYPRLVSIDLHGFSRNRLNFFEREREEMRVLTAATEIGPNVWLGNSQDVPTVRAAHARSHSMDSASSLVSEDGNPCSFSICIESHDQAGLVSREVLESATQVLAELEQQGRVCREVQPVLTADNEVVESATTLLRPPVEEVVHLETTSTAAALGTSSRAQDAFVAHIVELAVWIRDQSDPNPFAAATSDCPLQAPRRVLLHCGDGYTETSLLALAYVMLARRRSVSEAYLFLQLDCQRSFFVYTADRETVLKLERRVVEVLAREDDEERYTRRWLAEQRAVAIIGAARTACLPRSQAQAQDLARVAESGAGAASAAEDETVTLGLSSTSMGRSDSGFVDSTGPEAATLDGLSSVDEAKLRYALEDEAARAEAEIEAACGGPKRRMRAADPVQDAWFFGPTFEGHFPSRILPHLYLGNVKHASNALMLKELGITHVVSMGETALHPPRAPTGLSLLTSTFRSSATASSAPVNSLWEEEQAGTISVLDMQNVADDGIDSIRPCIDEALEFIRAARREGGTVLVHCKVGVSRSASIVIAYLMREMGLDLASSYLLTRSRRLNILVQPNLPFVAALHAFEAELLEDKERAIAASRPRNPPGHSPASSVGSASEYGEAVSDAAGPSGSHHSDDDEHDSLQVLGQPGLKRSNRLAFSFLCGEIARLNERFLG